LNEKKRIKHDVPKTTQLLKSILHFDVKCKRNVSETPVIVMKGNRENITKRLYTLCFVDYIHSDDFGSKVEVYIDRKITLADRAI